MSDIHKWAIVFLNAHKSTVMKYAAICCISFMLMRMYVMYVLFFASHFSVKMGPWQPFHPKIAKLSA